MHSFNLFNTMNLYLVPYGSDTNGGELLTEFNQRAAMNFLGSKVVGGEFKIGTHTYLLAYPATLTGTKGSADLRLSIVGSNLQIDPGEFLINGYYGNLRQALSINLSDLITAEEAAEEDPGQTASRLIKLELISTHSVGSIYDERLIPPVGNVYESARLLVASGDDPITINQLILGGLSRDRNGIFQVYDYTAKSQVLSLERISGMGSTTDWVSIPDTPGTYAVTEDGLVDISDALWLHFNSPLGEGLRYLTTARDDSNPGSETSTARMRKLMIGDGSDDALLWFQENSDKTAAQIEYLVLRGGQLSPNAYSIESIDLPNATYFGRDAGDIGTTLRGKKHGMLAPEDLWKLDQIWANFTAHDGLVHGTEYGPFLTTTEADNYFIQSGITPEVGDFYWVLNDTIDSTLVSNYGTVSGDVSINIQDQIPIEVANMPITATGSGSRMTGQLLTGRLDLSHGTVEGTVPLSVQASQINFDLEGGDTTYEFGGAELSAVFSGEVESTEELFTVSGTLRSEDPLSFTLPSPMTIKPLNPAATQTVAVPVTSATLRFTQAQGSDPVYIQVSDIDMNATISGAAAGTGTGNVSGTVVGKVTGTLNSFTQNVSSMYVYTTNGWVRRAVLRGYATPATTEQFGLVKSGSDSNLEDVIVDPDTGKLRLNTLAFLKLQEYGWVTNSTVSGIITESPETFPKTNYSGTHYLNPITFRLRPGLSGWDADAVEPLSRVRGTITVDLSEIVGDVSVPVINCNDIDTINIVGDTGAKVNVTNCVVTPESVNNINHWVNSRFTSGSNTVHPNNAWTVVENAFGTGFTNSVQYRFASFTRGEYGIVGGELDIWIKRESWTSQAELPESIDLRSIKNLKFPPLILSVDSEGNKATQVNIPEGLNLKVSGTAGVLTAFDPISSSEVAQGNLVATLDWIDGDVLSFNGRLLYSGTGIRSLHDIRLRVPVQVLPEPDLVEATLDYSTVYPST